MSEGYTRATENAFGDLRATDRNLFALLGQCAVVVHGLTLHVELLNTAVAALPEEKGIKPPDPALLNDVLAEAKKIAPLLRSFGTDE